MTRREFLRRYFPRFAASLAIVAILVYTVYHVAASSAGGLITTPVRYVEDSRILGSTAYLFRDESLLTTKGEGLILDLAQSGTKVSKDAPVAEVRTGLTGEELTTAQRRLYQLNRLITVLQSSTPPTGETMQQADAYRAQAQEASRLIRNAIAKGDWATLADLEDRMLIALNRYAALTGDTQAAEQALQALVLERNQLLVGTASVVSNTASSGYYYNREYVDGYEELFSTAALEELTPAGLESLAQTPPATAEEFSVGKMVYGYDWYLALTVRDTDGLPKEGYAYTVTFPESDGRTLRMTCHRVSTEQNVTLVILHADQIPTDFSFVRAQAVEITLGSTAGYYIPETAIHTVNGVEGVYIFHESTVRFRRIQVIYRGDGYCIAEERTDGDKSYLSVNDLLITSGKNLYDGKVY